MGRLFARHLEEVARWLEEQPNFQVLHVEYARVLEDPREEARKVRAFLGLGLDVEAMAGVVDERLYRQRKAYEERRVED